jgi:hypothetical protein
MLVPSKTVTKRAAGGFVAALLNDVRIEIGSKKWTCLAKYQGP